MTNVAGEIGEEVFGKLTGIGSILIAHSQRRQVQRRQEADVRSRNALVDRIQALLDDNADLRSRLARQTERAVRAENGLLAIRGAIGRG